MRLSQNQYKERIVDEMRGHFVVLLRKNATVA